MNQWGNCLSGLQGDIPTVGCIPVFFSLLLRAALVFAGVVAVILIIYGGINMAWSNGDPKKIEGAKKIITWAIIGLIVILLSFAIIIFIGYITGATECIDTISDPARFLTGC